MPIDDVVERAAEAVADGTTLDWDLLARGAQTDADRERLKCLRILREVADLHRSRENPVEAADEQTTQAAAGATDASPDDALHAWGRYRLLEKVGEGTFGSVYRAWDPELEFEIAIKILHRQVADGRLKERLLREGRALAKVRHANVVRVLGVESHEDRVGLCMEFVRGETLDGVVHTQGTLNARETALVGEDVCRALAAVHHAGFVHRDVKARNVMREQAGRIVLMDFGTGRETDQREISGRPDVAGTPLYMAPEVLAGQPASACSDVYSVGVLLYHLATSQYPVEADSVDHLREAHAQRRHRFLSELRPDLPAPFIRVVEKALAPDPRDRYPSAGALLEALGSVLGGAQRTTHTIWKYLLTLVLVATLLACGATALGLISSTVFNAALDRSGFAPAETWRNYFNLGVRSSVLPAAFLILGSLAAALFVALRRLALGLSSTAVTLDDTVRRRLGRTATRLHLNDASVLAAWILLLATSALVWAWWYFSPLLDAARMSISTGPGELLAMFSPALADYHEHYRQVFGWLVILTVAAWCVAFRLAAHNGQTLNRGMVAGGVATVVLSLVSFDLPYRLIFDNNFKAAIWNGTECYVIGERADEVLLFCPRLPPPRNRILQKSAETLERLDRSESIFTSFSIVNGSQ